MLKTKFLIIFVIYNHKEFLTMIENIKVEHEKYICNTKLGFKPISKCTINELQEELNKRLKNEMDKDYR